MVFYTESVPANNRLCTIMCLLLAVSRRCRSVVLGCLYSSCQQSHTTTTPLYSACRLPSASLHFITAASLSMSRTLHQDSLDLSLVCICYQVYFCICIFLVS